MTFAETLAILNWAAEQGAQNVQIGDVAVVFGQKAAPKEPIYQPGLSPHETRKQLDQSMFGVDLDSLMGGKE